MKAVIYPNFQKKNALVCARRVCDVLLDESIEVCVSDKYAGEFSDKPGLRFEPVSDSVASSDVVIAIGGDGTILRCAKYLMGTDTKLLGINTGTLGFMAGLEADQLEALKYLKTGNYHISERMTLDVTVCGKDGRTVYTALNDVCARSVNSKISDFEVRSDGYLIGRYRADGVIFSSPSGSTAYSLSAGGPIIEPELECIEMTLICPHSLFSRATLFSSDRVLEFIDTSENQDHSMSITIDGDRCTQTEENRTVMISKGKNKIKFIDLEGNSFHESLCKKLMKPIK